MNIDYFTKIAINVISFTVQPGLKRFVSFLSTYVSASLGAGSGPPLPGRRPWCQEDPARLRHPRSLTQELPHGLTTAAPLLTELCVCSDMVLSDSP